MDLGSLLNCETLRLGKTYQPHLVRHMATETTSAPKHEWAMPFVIMLCFFILGVWTLSNAWDLITTGMRPRYVSLREAGVIDILEIVFGKIGKTYVGGTVLIIEGLFYIGLPFYIEFIWSRKNQYNEAQRRAIHHSTIWMPIIFLLIGAAILCDQLGYVSANISFTVVLIAAAVWSHASGPKAESEPDKLDTASKG